MVYTCFLSSFYSRIKWEGSLLKRDNAYLLTAQLLNIKNLPVELFIAFFNLLWDFMKITCNATSGTFCTTTSLRDEDAKGSYEVAAGRKSAERSRWASHVALESKCFNLRREPLSRTSSQSSRLGERNCDTAGEKTTKTSRWATWQTIKSGRIEFVFSKMQIEEPFNAIQGGGCGDSKWRLFR